jgi:hypothetical protein
MVRSPFGPKRKASANPRWERPRDLRAAMVSAAVTERLFRQWIKARLGATELKRQILKAISFDAKSFDFRSVQFLTAARFVLRGGEGFALCEVDHLVSPEVGGPLARYPFNKDTMSGSQEAFQ